MTPSFDKPKLSEPNEAGYQFGIDKSLTDYAHKEVIQSATTSLPPVKITVLQVWKDDKHITNLLVDEKTNKVLQECHGFEATAVAIDKFKLIKQMSNDTSRKSCKESIPAK